MPSTPFICASMGWATLWAMVSGVAPGYCAATCTEGGVSSGYWEMGSLPMARTPSRIMKMEMTAENTGRFRKNPS